MITLRMSSISSNGGMNHEVYFGWVNIFFNWFQLFGNFWDWNGAIEMNNNNDGKKYLFLLWESQSLRQKSELVGQTADSGSADVDICHSNIFWYWTRPSMNNCVHGHEIQSNLDQAVDFYSFAMVLVQVRIKHLTHLNYNWPVVAVS